MVLFLQYIKYSLKIFGLLVGIISFTGCYRTECPAYPDEYLNWIPYKLGGSAYFTDGKDTFKLYVRETYKSGAYKQHSIWNMEFPCDISAEAYISGESNSSQIMVNSEHHDVPDEPAIFYNYSISVNNNDWSDFNFSVTDYDITTDHGVTPVQLLDNYNNGYKDYSNVLKLEMDTVNWLNPKMIYIIYVAESVGIIQFTETLNHKTWSLFGK